MRKKNVGLKARQQGFTLVELLLVSVIAVVVIALIIPLGLSMYDSSRGKSEGQYVTSAALCGAEKGRSISSTGSVTFALMLNNGCFGRNERIQNGGTATATLNNSLTNQPYTVGTCNVVGTNDGLYVETQSAQDECTAVVEAAANRGANVISVIPNGGSAVVVKASTAKVDLATAGLNTACKGTAPIAVRSCVRF